MFRSGIRKLTFFYAAVMCVFLGVLIFGVHGLMKWAITSEQEQELIETAISIRDAQSRAKGDSAFDESIIYKNASDRLFFYIFDEKGTLIRFSRGSYRIEPFVLDIIESGVVPRVTTEVFGKIDENRRRLEIMMTSVVSGRDNNVIYVGKDVTAVYSGLEKATYAILLLGLVSVIFSTAAGYFMARRALYPMKSAYEKQRQFAADASHELRTPLAVVLASAELLENDPTITSPFLKQVVLDVKDEVKKMTKLVSDLLMVARSDNHALKIAETEIDLGELLEQAVRTMSPLGEKKKVVVSAAGEFPSEKIFGDEQKIRQLITILVDNAIKYTPEGGKVTVGFSEAKSGRVAFFVEDTGIGIAKEDLPKIFDRFYRVDKARSRQMGGNGLGLAIADEIVYLHRGSIDVTSDVGKGTRFTVTLRVGRKMGR
ncbi:MAG: sensor histidine kinase [Selenomonadaceae bacterium]|nr:sensor histidine kinase [Selenomonadaceae bacterium]MBR3722519.1 sensor histidine kinase [Selenomonadaceae bacterium]